MERRYKVLAAILTVIALLSVCVALWALFWRDPTPVLPPDERPAPEENALPTGEDDGEKMDQPAGGGAVNLTYSDQVRVSLSDGTARLMFSNPARSNQSVVIQLVIQGITVAQSGALAPGNQVETLPLLDTAQLSPGDYAGVFRVLIYNADGERALLNTEIPVSIGVVEQSREEASQ